MRPWEAHTGVRGPWRMWGLQEPEVHSLRFLSLRFKSRCFGWMASRHSRIIPVGVRGHSSWPGTASRPPWAPHRVREAGGTRADAWGPARQMYELPCVFLTPHSWKGQARPGQLPGASQTPLERHQVSAVSSSPERGSQDHSSLLSPRPMKTPAPRGSMGLLGPSLPTHVLVHP